MMRSGTDVRRGAICYVTDRRLTAGRPLLGIIEAAIRGGVDLIQIRDKDLDAAELLNIARAALEMAKATGGRCRIMVNDRLDVALAARA
jgi:thiamine monophosphate synthase